MTTSDHDGIEYELGVAIPGRILPEDRWARTAVKKLPPTGPLDWAAMFGRTAPVALDLGCGNGRFLLASALTRPDWDHMGVDILPVVIRYATRRANQRGLSNVRLAVCGGREFLDKYVADGSVREIHVYHPQPYSDAQKTERRLLTPEFFAQMCRCLAPGGLFVVQTDNSAYWKYLERTAPEFFEFQRQIGPWPDAPEGRSRREIMARRQGLEIFRGWGVPRTDHTAEELAALAATLPQPMFDASAGRNPRRHRKRPPRRRGR
jgi:tRNA (guanine-N7-)-methyltransferase